LGGVRFSSDFQPAAVFCAVSTAIFQSGLAGILALSAKRRICLGDLRKAAAVAEAQAELVVGNIGQRGDKIVARRQEGVRRLG